MPRIVDHDQRRQEVAAAVLRVVVRLGLDGVTMREVAAESGWSTGVLAHYFERKDNLLHGALVEAARQSGLSIRRIRHSSLSPLETVRRLLEEFLPLDQRRLANTQIFQYFYGQGVLDPRTSAELSSYFVTMRRVVRQCIEDGQADGSIRSDLDPVLIAELLTAVSDGLGLEGTIDMKILPPRRQREHVQFMMDLISAKPTNPTKPTRPTPTSKMANGSRAKSRARAVASSINSGK